MGDFRIVIDAVGGHGQDRDKKDGEVVNFYQGGNTSPDAIAKTFTEMLKAYGTNVQSAKIIHWPMDNYPGSRSVQIVDDLLTGKRSGRF